MLCGYTYVILSFFIQETTKHTLCNFHKLKVVCVHLAKDTTIYWEIFQGKIICCFCRLAYNFNLENLASY